MRQDVKSNYLLASALSLLAAGVGAHASSGVNHSEASSASFLINLVDNGTAGTVDAKLQYLEPDNVTWTDYPANDPMGNDSAITQLTTEGSAVLAVVNPRGIQSRVEVTVGTEACAVTVASVLGPLRHIAAA